MPAKKAVKKVARKKAVKKVIRKKKLDTSLGFKQFDVVPFSSKHKFESLQLFLRARVKDQEKVKTILSTLDFDLTCSSNDSVLYLRSVVGDAEVGKDAKLKDGQIKADIKTRYAHIYGNDLETFDICEMSPHVYAAYLMLKEFDRMGGFDAYKIEEEESKK